MQDQSVGFRKHPLNIVRVAALCIILIAPWLYGGALEWTIIFITNYLICLTVAAIIGWLIACKKPKLDWIHALTIIVLILGWLASSNPIAIYDDMLMTLFPLEIPSWRLWLPSTVDAERSVRTMQTLTGLVGLLWIVRDMCADRFWRSSLFWTLTLAGCSIAIYGILQKNSGDLWGYWGVKKTGYAFASFWYHANAASFLNLIWPFVVALSLESFARNKNHFKKALLLAATLSMISAVLINVSKAGHLIFACLVPLMAVLVLPDFLRTITGRDSVGRYVLICIASMMAVSLILAFSLGLDKTLRRWDEMKMERFTGDSRYDSAAFCLGELPRAGLTGFGPGTFEPVFLDVGTTHPEKVPKARWKFAHQDTLQTMLEWGWIGGSLWISLGVGVCISIFKKMKKLQNQFFSSRYTFRAAAFTSLIGVALHAQMDFPLQVLGVQVIVAAVAGFGTSAAR